MIDDDSDNLIACIVSRDGDVIKEVHANEHFNDQKFTKDEKSSGQNEAIENKFNENGFHAETLTEAKPCDTSSSSSKDSNADVKQFIEVSVTNGDCQVLIFVDFSIVYSKF